jgi:two-component system sensor histidine kinase KdpD
VGTFTISSGQDIVNLVVFFVTAGLVGMLASRRRGAQLRAQALADKLGQLNQELLRLNKEQAEAAEVQLQLTRSEERVRGLEELDRLRQELLANVSHELRTPIGTILTRVTGLLSQGRVDGGTAVNLRAIENETRRLKLLVDDMLDLARIQGGALDLQLEPILLADAISSAVERLHRRSPDRPVVRDPETCSVEVLADWISVGQVLDNLLSNADRYGPKGTPIEIEVSGGRDSMVTLRVRDRGPGVPAGLREHIFERFFGGDSSADRRQGAGTGLGLAIVRGLVEAHGGSVALEEAPEVGATFRITLPSYEEPALQGAEDR